MRKTLLAVAFSFASAVPAMAQIGSTLDPSGGYAGPFGPVAAGGTPSFAQTFTRTAGMNYLQSFAFFLGDNSDNGSGTQFRFQTFVYEVSGSSLGNQVYAGPTRNGSANFFGFDTYSYSGLNLLLNPSVTTFALVLRSVSSANGALNVIGAGSTNYAGGSFFVVNPNNSLSTVDGTEDAAFSATFTQLAVVPEPATLLLCGAGLLIVGVVARQRHRIAGSSV